jgi:cytochrome P450
LLLKNWRSDHVFSDQTHNADNSLQQYMKEMIDVRRAAETKGDQYDLFSGLLDASEESVIDKLSDSELMGGLLPISVP